MGLSRLAALHGVATSYSPSPDVTVSVPDDTVIAVLAALGVDAGTPADVRKCLAAAESRSRLLPPTVVVWAGEPCRPLWPACPRLDRHGRAGAVRFLGTPRGPARPPR